jgi:hypothetical protein
VDFPVADSLVYDVEKIASYRSDGRFDYYSQSPVMKDGVPEFLSRWFNRLLNTVFGGKFEEKYTTPVMIFLFIAILLAALFFLYRKRPELFMRPRRTKPLPYGAEEENINAIDFDSEIAAALDAGNYRLAIRMVYLHTLRILSDRRLIDWQIYKTSTDYLYEMARKELKEPFCELTHHFLLVRYGRYDASPELFEAMTRIFRHIRQATEGSALHDAAAEGGTMK